MSGKEIVAAEHGTHQTPEAIRRLAEEIYSERVVAAREMPPEEKLLAGEELFDYACSITLAGIRDEFPDASEEARLKILADRLQLRERMEKRE